MRVRFIRSLIFAFLIAASAGIFGASASASTLTGTVSDSSGKVIPGAMVTATNEATSVNSATTTDKAGLYVIPNLTPGVYQINVQQDGFKSVVKKDVALHAEENIEVNISMEVGSLNQSITVESGAPVVQLTSATLTSTVTETAVAELPVNGRSWTDLAVLQPGITSIHALPDVSTPDRIGRGLGNQLTISGARPQQNNYVINGISMNDYTNGAPGSLQGGNLGVDAIQEFTVLTANYSAEYGRTSGGVISAITRSGSNALHGSAYEFIRNSALDARNFFDGPTIPPFRRNQFGASEGAPIQKDKTFIFGDYEGLRQQLGLSQLVQVPSLAARSGTLCSTDPSAPPDCSQTMQVAVDPAVVPYLAFYPKPNGALLCPGFPGPCVGGDVGNYQFSGAQTSSENFFTFRVDHTFSGKDNLFGTYSFDGSTLDQTDEFDNKIINARTRRQIVTIQENHIFRPTLVNSIRFGYNRSFGASPVSATAVNPLAADTTLGFVPGDTSGTLDIPGITSFSGGLSTQAPQSWTWNSFQVFDDVSMTRGIHSMKFGANVERIQDNSFSPSRPGGGFVYNSLQDFLTNQAAQSFRTDVPGLLNPRYLRQTIVGGYAQDDMRVFQNLTVNVGLRYEMATVPSEIHGELSTLVNFSNSAALHLGNPIFANPTHRNFEPRVGFAWDPFHNGKTSVRGGFGMFDVLPLPIELRGAVFAVFPFFDSASVTPSSSNPLSAGDFPNNAFNRLTTDESSARVDYIEPNPKRNYVMQWSLSVQREVLPNTAVLIAYVGSRAVHNALQTDDSNIVLPTLTSAGYLWPCGPDGTGNACASGFSPSGTQANPIPGALLNPNVARISSTFFNSDASYHALEVQVVKRLSRGFQLQGSYTWARSIDTSSGSTDGDQFLNGISSLLYFDRALRRGPSDFNVDQNLVINYVWDLPTPRGLKGALAWPVSGWQWNGILTLTGGVPFTALIGGDPLGENNVDPFGYPNRVTSGGCSSPVNPGNPDSYIKLNCFSLPNAPSSFAAQCVNFPGATQPAPNGQVYCANLLGSETRNALIGPGLADFDMSFFKNNPIKKISESFNVQFRAEIFNILNHPNFVPPTDNEFLFNQDGSPVPGAGQITRTSTTSRQIQFALKFIW
ncbi:MAG TPA: TonB-dependent receptor [Candidatus Acidoferrales bacterium]|nr:TonB-dependent receptor [Candidatus Acidoferrales bacterium]